MDDHGYCYLCIVVQSDEEHDRVPGDNLEVLVVDDYIALAGEVSRQTGDCLDDIPWISQVSKQERDVVYVEVAFDIFQIQNVKPKSVAPEVTLRSKEVQMRVVADEAGLAVIAFPFGDPGIPDEGRLASELVFRPVCLLTVS